MSEMDLFSSLVSLASKNANDGSSCRYTTTTFVHHVISVHLTDQLKLVRWFIHSDNNNAY